MDPKLSDESVFNFNDATMLNKTAAESARLGSEKYLQFNFDQTII